MGSEDAPAAILPERTDQTLKYGRKREDDSHATTAPQAGVSVECPDGGYGWVCVASVFCINALTWGVVASYGVFLSYYLSHDTFKGATTLDYALVGGLNFGAAMLVAPLVTAAARYTGIHLPMTLGACVFGGGWMAASFASQIWHLYLTQGVLVGLGVGLIYIPSIPVLSQWFQHRRSLANGISTAGSGIGGLVYSFAAAAMLEHWTLAWTLRVVGITTCSFLLVATAFIRDRNAIVRPKQRPFDRTLLRQPGVPWLLAWAFVVMLGYTTLLYTMSDFARSIGLSESQAFQVTALLNVGTATGRPFIGVASDKLGRFNVAAGLTMFCGIICFAIWIPAETFAVTLVFSIMSGAILGAFWATVGPLCTEVVGLTELPSLMALVWLTIVLPTTYDIAVLAAAGGNSAISVPAVLLWFMLCCSKRVTVDV